MQILELLNSGSKELKNNNINSHKLDSEILLAKILNKKREEILINLDDQAAIPQMAARMGRTATHSAEIRPANRCLSAWEGRSSCEP